MGQSHTQELDACAACRQPRDGTVGQQHGRKPAAPERASPIRVYLVDDEPIICAGLRGLLDPQRGFVVCGEAGSEEEALQGILSAQPDLALVELVLSRGSGLSLIRRLHALCPAVKTLVFSGLDQSHLAKSAMDAGAQGYVLKEEDTKRIVDALQVVHNQGHYISKGIIESVSKEGSRVCNVG